MIEISRPHTSSYFICDGCANSRHAVMALNLTELREAYQALRDHHVAETTALFASLKTKTT
jgi:hypothetical protein